MTLNMVTWFCPQQETESMSVFPTTGDAGDPLDEKRSGNAVAPHATAGVTRGNRTRA